MCNKCTKLEIGKKLVGLEIKLGRIYQELMDDPSNLDTIRDNEFVKLADTMGKLLDKYKELK